jgi:argininosuccinate lyase
LKGLPSAYDKDLQEDKLPVFQAYDNLAALLPVLAAALHTLTVRAEQARASLEPALLATDLADYLVERGAPFREAHTVAGKAVSLAISRATSLDRLSLEDLQGLHPSFAKDVYEVFDYERSVGRRAVTGGTAPSAVAKQLEAAKGLLAREQP